eukprot:scaffold243555_cov19-Prasinocladus_malaysianus.AAC.1
MPTRLCIEFMYVSLPSRQCPLPQSLLASLNVEHCKYHSCHTFKGFNDVEEAKPSPPTAPDTHSSARAEAPPA